MTSTNHLRPNEMNSENLPVIDSCEGCGACCFEIPSPPLYSLLLCPLFDGQEKPDIVPDTDEDLWRVRNMPVDLRNDLASYFHSAFILDKEAREPLHPNKGACIWFDWDSRRCKHHEWRPSGLSRF